MMDLFRLSLCLCALACALIGCDNSTAAPAAPLSPDGQPALSGKLILTGSSTVAPLASELAKRFESQHPNVRIDVQTGGSSRGIADVKRGTADIGMASRALTPDETDLTGHTIAHDGITLIVHKNNPIAELTEQQIKAIYLGQTTHWSQLGGLDAPITVVHKAEGRSTLELFLAHFDLDNKAVKPSIIIGDNQHGIATVAGNVNAIGYVSIGTAEYEAQAGTPVKLLPLDGVAASRANVSNGSFPLARPLTLVTHGEVSPLAQAFIDFTQSDRVHDLVKAQYFVPLGQ